MSENSKYTAEDIRLYLEGKLSPAEMHAMEKASLDDRFLADAIEGMQQYGNNQKFFVESAQLKESLKERIRKKNRVVAFPVQMLWKIAAVLILVVTGVAVIIYTGEKNNPARVEIAEKEVRPVPSRKADSTVMNFYKDSVVATFKKEKPVSTFKKQDVRLKTEEAKPDNKNAPERSLEADEPEAIEPPPAAPQISDSVPSVRDNAEISNALEGRAAGVDVSKQDSDLQEVVVTAYGTSKKNKRYNSPLAKNTTERRIIPAGGWQQFETYLDQNKNTNVYDTTLTGAEKVSFVIDEAGRPSLITIINSISAEHDKELIRLINEGPSWEVKKGNKRKVVLSVLF